ncbi:ATP-binding cassette domain-containing protein [Streptomyces sp. 35M1]|uniref:ATP-binding cassette domain-containing protein n=1 Tax=Streptomyces sp. 35M1 TaxID=3142978 RepID=UPI003990D503
MKTELSTFVAVIPGIALIACLERRMPPVERSAVRRVDARDIVLVSGFALLVSVVAAGMSFVGSDALLVAACNNLLFCGLALAVWPLLGAYVAWLKGEDRTGAWERAGTALGQVGLAEESGRKTAELSGGRLRRAGIACALAHDARVILLDEPTAGLDPHQRTVFRAVLRKVTERIPVLMSTHDIADLADEANTVSLMNGGRILHHGATGTFLEHARTDAAPGRQAESAYSVLMGLEGAE